MNLFLTRSRRRAQEEVNVNHISSGGGEDENLAPSVNINMKGKCADSIKPNKANKVVVVVVDSKR